MGEGWGKFFVVPIETGRGCPYGCEFCTVTGFFGDSIRFRTNESVIEELLRLKARAKKEKGQIAVFFIDDNLAINKKRSKVAFERYYRRRRTTAVGRTDQRESCLAMKNWLI